MPTDNIERKELNNRFLYFKGTISKTAAISTSADLLVHDESSRSNQQALETYKSRTKDSPYKGRWLFSNPTTEKDLLDQEWHKSDQKEWHITCPHCSVEHFMVWPDNIDKARKCFICRHCKEPIDDDVRRNGRWIAQNPDSKISGYHISHLIATKISAEEIIEDSEGDQEYFHNFVLGEPYNPGDLSVSRSTITDIWTPKSLVTGNYFLGVDVGNIKHYTLWSEKGIVKVGKFSNWQELDDMISFYKIKSGVIDAMPDNTMAKYYVEKYPCMQMSFFQENASNPQTIVWYGENDKKGIVYSHRDRVIDRMLADMIEAKFLIGVPTDKSLIEYVKHFETLRRVKVTNNKGIERYCFVAGTKIITENGERNIEDIKKGDRLLTRNGFRTVVHTMNREAEVVNRGAICGTADHPVFTDKGIQHLCSIPLDANIYIWHQRKLYIKVLRFIDTLIQNLTQIENTLDPQRSIEKWGIKDFIRKYIKITLVKSRKVLSCTIKTMMRLTIYQKTWGCYIKENTINTTSINTIKTQCGPRKDLRYTEVKKCSMASTLGKKPRLLSLSLESMAETIFSFRKLSNLFAKDAEKYVRPDTNVAENIAVNGAETNTITENIGEKNKQRVYNLTVWETPEYFANGVLVHNCWESTTNVDHFVFATLYGWLALQGNSSGVFWGEPTEENKKPVIDSENNYDVTAAFSENNYGN